MTYRQIIQAIGEEILDYLLASYPEGSDVKLTIDKYTFTQIYKNLGFTEAQVITALSDIQTLTNGFAESLAVAAYQTIIAYDINQSRYYDKLQDAYKNTLNSHSDVIRYFEYGQDDMWQYVQKCFQRNNRKFHIPPSHEGPYRYVQYPYAQLVMSQSALIKFADVFNQFLIPHKAYTLQAFGKIIRSSNYSVYNDFQLRLIYSFYLAWDGQSSDDYRRNRTTGSRHTTHEISSYIIYANDEDQSYILKKTISSMKYATVLNFKKLPKCTYFNYDEDYEVWTSCRKNMVDPETSNGILIDSNHHACKIDNLTYSHVYKIPESTYVFLSFDDSNAKNNFYSIFQINITQDLSYWLSGGIKLGKTKTYALNALPKMNFATEEKTIYINRQCVEFPRSKYILLGDFITKPGEYHIKLPDRPSISIIVEKLDSVVFRPKHTGWIIANSNVEPSSTETWNIRGKEINSEDLEPIAKSLSQTYIGQLRPMTRHKEQFECRFDRFKNKDRRFS